MCTHVILRPARVRGPKVGRWQPVAQLSHISDQRSKITIVGLTWIFILLPVMHLAFLLVFHLLPVAQRATPFGLLTMVAGRPPDLRARDGRRYSTCKPLCNAALTLAALEVNSLKTREYKRLTAVGGVNAADAIDLAEAERAAIVKVHNKRAAGLSFNVSHMYKTPQRVRCGAC